ncbi:MAG: peptidyl-prolyl cis-trans isomerase [Candidatus Latescibacteria bacterium]|nr:peptidyl-prolyl cis-trans isomerase [Candidatus Latescibacterota bacterium]
MKQLVAVAALTALIAGAAGAQTTKKELPVVVFETTKGNIEIELYPDKAPITVQNFLYYVDNKFYDGLIFHRVIPDFMVQGGGFTPEMSQKQGKPAIEIESDNGLTNDKYTVAMARTSDPNSATSQFFINVKDNAFLNFKSKTAQGWGYAVFGKVTAGQNVVHAIEKVKTGAKNGMNDVPVEVVKITKAYRKGAAPAKEEAKTPDNKG